LTGVQRKVENLARAIERGGDLPSLVEAVRHAEGEQRELRESLPALDRAQALATVDLAALGTHLRARLEDWRGILTRHVGSGRLTPLLAGIVPLSSPCPGGPKGIHSPDLDPAPE
jgi:hypothetical protein